MLCVDDDLSDDDNEDDSEESDGDDDAHDSTGRHGDAAADKSSSSNTLCSLPRHSAHKVR